MAERGGSLRDCCLCEDVGSDGENSSKLGGGFEDEVIRLRSLHFFFPP